MAATNFINGLYFKITKPTEAMTVRKGNGTEVVYFIFDKFEVHTNVILAGGIQDLACPFI